MKQIIISTIILILSNSFLFGMFSFGAWNVNPACWQEGTRVMFSFISFSMFSFWIAFIITHLLDCKAKRDNRIANSITLKRLKHENE